MSVLTRRLLPGGGSFSTAARYPTWAFSRYSGNPVITIPAGETAEQYVPAPIRLPNDDIWVYVKGNSRIYAWKSTDNGATFSIQNGGTAVLVPVAATWELAFVVEPAAVYDETTDTIHLYWKGTDLNPANWQWGHATAPGATPTVFTRDAGNPILTKANAQTQLGGGTTTDLAISSVLVVGSVYHFFGYAAYNSRYQLVHATGTTWNNPSGLTSLLLAENDSRVVETPSVFRMPGTGTAKYAMLYARGDPQPGYRDVESATSSDLATWDFSDTTGVLVPTTGWESNETYSGAMLKSRIGEPIAVGTSWQFYYSGLSAAPIAQVGIAYQAPTP